jgi:hypothetical protein
VTCNLLATCKFFKEMLASKPVTAATFQTKYCQTDPEHCARFIVAENLGVDSVPDDLFPNQDNRIDKILHRE